MWNTRFVKFAAALLGCLLAAVPMHAADPPADGKMNEKKNPDWVQESGHPKGAWWENNPKYQGAAAAELWKKIPIPPADPLEPEKAIESFKVPAGFRVELVAAEPMIANPVQIVFGPDGRLWVVEMRGFMNDVNGTGESDPTGRVVTLEDTDGDGRMDKSIVFVEGLVMPRTIALVAGGVLVAEPPNIWLCRDTDGDGRSDEKTSVSANYGAQDNPEHSDNGLVFTIDNWLYSAKSNLRHRFAGGKLIEERTAFRGQWGIAADDYGRLFYNYNASPLHADLFAAEYAARNPNLQTGGRGSSSAINAAIATDKAVYPVRVTPGVTLGLTDLRPDGTLKQFTAACGPTIYRGQQFPEEFRGNAFICEPVGNLVKRYRIESDGVRLAAVPAYANSEFLASTDERFRPVWATTGPDGALYIADMYNGIIEHKRYMTAYLREQVLSRGLEKPAEMGRIYRIVHEGAPIGPLPRLTGMSPDQLVAQLDSPNGAVRDMAQRMIVQGGLMQASAALQRMVSDGAKPLGRLHALWTLEGLGQITLPIVTAAMDDADPMVRAAAVRISERLIDEHRAVLVAVYRKLATDAQPPVALQLLLTLGTVGGEEAEAAMASLLTGPRDGVYIEAAISGLHGREATFAARLMRDPQWAQASRHGAAVIAALARAVIVSRDPGQIAALLEAVNAAGISDWRSQAALGAIPRAKLRGAPVKLAAKPAVLDALAASNDPAQMARIEQLTSVITFPGDTTVRAGAVRDLTADEFKRFAAGKATYALICAACHQPTGQGMVGLAPTLIDTEWVQGPAEVPIRIALHGMAGPVKVNGEDWNLTMVGWAAMLDDAKLADVLTYVRREWGNTGEPVTAEQVAAVRNEFKDRVTPWTADELTPLLGAKARPAGDKPAKVKAMKERGKPSAEAPAERSDAPVEAVKPAGDGTLTLHARQARCVGPKIEYMAKEDALGWWTDADHAEWVVDGVAPGKYAVHLTWSVHPKSAGKPFVVEAGGARLAGKAESTGGWETFKTARLGVIEIAADVKLIAVKPGGRFPKALMDLRELRLEPIR